MELITEIAKTDPQLAEYLLHLLNEFEMARTERRLFPHVEVLPCKQCLLRNPPQP